MQMLRSSERATFKRCPQKWDWSYNQGLTPIGQNRTPLWFGTGIHLCMAEWYIPGGTKRGKPLAETWDAYSKDVFQSIKMAGLTDESEAEYIDARELGFEMIKNYLEEYGEDEHWHIIAPEQRFSVLIPHPQDPNKPIVNMVGTYDMVIRDLNDGKVKMVDHKTARDLYVRHLTMDEQAGGYIATGTHTLREQGLIGPKEAIKGMEYNILRKAKADDRPVNDRGMATNKPQKKHYLEAFDKAVEVIAASTERPLEKLTLAALEQLAEEFNIKVFGDESKVQPLPLFLREFVGRTPRERNNQIRRIGQEAVVMRHMRKARLPILKTPNRDCATMCDFFDLCEIHEAGGDYEDIIRYGFRKQDPYADHREGADNSKTSLDHHVSSGVSGFKPEIVKD